MSDTAETRTSPEKDRIEPKSAVRLSRLGSALVYDLIFQWRHGFYAVYGVFCAIYIGALLPVPAGLRSRILPILVFTDPSVVGYFFIGGIMLLERDQGIFASLFVTPYTPEEYIVSKVISFLLLSLATSFIIAVPLSVAVTTVPEIAVSLTLKPGLLAAAVLLTSPLFTLIGIIVGSRMRVLNGYLLLSIVLMPPLFAPLLEMLGLLPGSGETEAIWRTLLWIIPTKSSLTLFRAAFGEPAPVGELLFSVGYLTACTGLAAWGARRWFGRYVVSRLGGE
jgi:fluoroquinolone transport system permease protein